VLLLYMHIPFVSSRPLLLVGRITLLALSLSLLSYALGFL
jgi:hypothetical protein